MFMFGPLDIPAWATSTAAYCASLAHKANHSFDPNCQFVVFDHPKFGRRKLTESSNKDKYHQRK